MYAATLLSILFATAPTVFLASVTVTSPLNEVARLPKRSSGCAIIVITRQAPIALGGGVIIISFAAVSAVATTYADSYESALLTSRGEAEAAVIEVLADENRRRKSRFGNPRSTAFFVCLGRCHARARNYSVSKTRVFRAYSVTLDKNTCAFSYSPTARGYAA